MIITMKSFKHSSSRPHKLRINPTDNKYCPILALKHFCERRGTIQGPIFLKSNGRPLMRHQVASMLKEVIALLSLKMKSFNTHSLCIGKITDLAESRASQNTLREAGRFHSSAYLKYFRPKSVSVPQV